MHNGNENATCHMSSLIRLMDVMEACPFGFALQKARVWDEVRKLQKRRVRI